MAHDPAFDGLRAVIRATFPKIHWEVWQNSTPGADRYQGGLDPWQYGIQPPFQSAEGSREDVISALIEQLIEWLRLSNPEKANRLALARAEQKLRGAA